LDVFFFASDFIEFITVSIILIMSKICNLSGLHSRYAIVTVKGRNESVFQCMFFSDFRSVPRGYS